MEGKVKTAPLVILGAEQSVPLTIAMHQQRRGMELALLLLPRRREGLLVLQSAGQVHTWRPGATDAPASPETASTMEQAAKRLTELRARTPEAAPSTLRGAWRGELVLGDVPVVRLSRKLAPYVVVSIWSGAAGWSVAVAREERWFARATQSATTQHAHLEVAIKAGLARALDLVAEACSTRDTTRRPPTSSAPAPPTKPPPADPTVRLGARARPSSAAPIPAALREVGVEASQVASHSGPRLDRVVLKLSNPADMQRLSRKLDVVAFALNQPAGALSLETGPGDRQVSLFVPRPRKAWKVSGLPELKAARPPRGLALPACFGVDVQGVVQWLDLAASSRGHVLIAGATGAGKSAVLHTLLCSILLHSRPELVLIDPKQVELAPYARLGRVANTGAEAQAALNRAIEEMERRYTALRTAGVQHIGQHPNMRRMLIVIEELAELLLVAPDVETALVRLAQKGRAAGLHLICTTQRPDATILRGLLRSNLDTRVALNVPKAADSRIILDEDGAERLGRPGDLLLKLAGEPAQRLHGLLLSPADVRAVVQTAAGDKPARAA